MEPIQLFVPTFRIKECLAEIEECLEKGWTGLGFKTVEIENAWCEYTGLPHSHFLSSATAGLHLAVKILKEIDEWSAGDEVISTPLTFVSTNHAIRYEGLKVVFADVDQYLCLDPDDIERRVTPRTRAVVFVGIGGSTGQLERVMEVCRVHSLRLIIDAAHMAGTLLRGKTPGIGADAIVYSFQAVKNLPTADLGMICFKDPELDKIARQQSWLGIDKDTYSRSTSSAGAYKWLYSVPHLGYKYHGNSITAAIALVQLRYLDHDNAYRHQLSHWYNEGFQGDNRISLVPTPAGCHSSRHLYQILVANRDELILALNNEQIYPGVHYRDNTEYPMYEYASGTCLRAKSVSNSVISLPLHLRLRRSDVLRIVDCLLRNVRGS